MDSLGGCRRRRLLIVALIAFSMIVPVAAFTGFIDRTAALMPAAGSIESATFPGDSSMTTSYRSFDRAVNYSWYDMFAVPNGEWWDTRRDITGIDEPLTDTYPYLTRWYGASDGDTWIYSSARLDVSASNLDNVNMSSWPEFLPMLGTHRGGNASIDWYMQYMTYADSARYPPFIGSQMDGWITILNGTTVLDRDAARTVMGLSSADFDDFALWWFMNEEAFKQDYGDWLNYEGRMRLDIYNTYEYPFTLMFLDITAQKFGSQIVLAYDIVSWGMEVLIASWLREAFIPGEWYFEDFNLQASIGPESTDLSLDTAVEYALFASATTEEMMPCWRWEPRLGDVRPSSVEHPDSDYDPYNGQDHRLLTPGSDIWGSWIPYDYTPAAFNLSENESLSLQWPLGPQLFLSHGGSDDWNTTHVYAPMEVRYSEPSASDMPLGQYSVDSVNGLIEFVGPFDMWSWSKDQSAYGGLEEGWDRVGAVPYGIPMIEFAHEIQPRYAAYLSIEGVASPVDTNTAEEFTVQVLDQYLQPYPFYNGTVSFYSSDPSAVLPADYTFVGEGEHNFTAVFNTPGYANLTVIDWADTNLTDTVTMIMVGPYAVALSMECPATVQIGVPFSVVVTAWDQFGQICSNYTGTVHFTTTDLDSGVVLPADYVFLPFDWGIHTFVDGFVLMTAGMQDLSVEDVSDASLTANATIEVVEMSPFMRTYTIYDMFDEPFGWWWGKRLQFYYTDLILTNESGMHTYYVMTGKTDMYSGLIYAPYRYAIDARNQSTLSIDSPVFMPVLGPEINGSSVELDIYFQYLDPDWWEYYWVPTWVRQSGTIDEEWLYRSGADGYDLGVVYAVEMNREAAEQWLGMPMVADVDTWWASNNATYTSNWESWIYNQGNEVYDIFCGYEWPYDINGGTWMSLDEDPATGDVTLTIGHIVLGYEILMTRWLSDRATDISPLEPYYEDFSMHVDYSEYSADVSIDAVAQYSLHAVKANQTTDDPAWVWEPNKVDYITKIGHPSDFKPYSLKTYQSWNAADTYFGQQVRYETTPNWFNLSADDQLIIQLPTGLAPGYKGIALTDEDITDIMLGDKSSIYQIMENGTMALGYHVTGWPVGSGLDLEPLYDGGTRTLTVQGPVNFNNYWHTPTGVLYHGAPWIEFNVIGDQAGLPPVADAGPDQGVMPGSLVFFDGSGSYDDGPTLNYTWTFEYDGVPQVLYGVSPSFMFITEGLYNVTLIVRDSGNQTASDTVFVLVDADIPEFGAGMVSLAAALMCVIVIAASARRRRRG